MANSNAQLPSLAPICLFAFNRPEHTLKTIESLLKNLESKRSVLYVFCDGPRNIGEKTLTDQVRKYLTSLEGFADIHLRFQNENLGLAKSIILGVTEVIQNHGRVIVVEDDLVTSPYFLQYMNENLTRYENEDRVISIHAYSYPTRQSLPEVFFLKGADCWGWATWRRGWDLFEADGQKLLQQLKAKKLLRTFDFDGSYPYVKMLQDQIAGRNNSWAIRWYASAFLADKLTLYPGRSLVNNIGLDGSGTHCEESNIYFADTIKSPMPESSIPIVENQEARKAFIDFFRLQQPGILNRVARKVKRWLDRYSPR